MSDTSRTLRAALERPELVVAPFVYDGLQARLAEAAGFEAAYMTGFGTAAARGLPDLGLLTMSEMVENARTLARSVAIPIVCDADTGYGSPLNVMRTVREYERAGAAALHIEDQVWPKRCGFLEGKAVIPRDEMVSKVRAACDARRDPDFVIIARTDALAPEGWESAERRARAYRDAGADLVFVDGIRSLRDLDTYAERLADLPRLYNGQLLPSREIEQRGFRLMIHTGTLAIAFRAVRDALAELRETGAIRGAGDLRTFAELVTLLGVGAALETEKKYTP
ncbi:MAG: isocitrate lyase/PEP mutase family protein [Deltaproteobacteria bacterium]|nr:MAG: isocitrate lyase/PEP mutase family protein [Deltaproteobacteria bacterium]